MRDKRDIAVDGFWDAHHGERVTPPLRFLEQCFSPALRAITANGEENIDAAPNEIVHSAGHVHGTAGSAQNGAGLQMNPTHDLRRENKRFGPPFRIQPLIAPPKA